MKNTILVLSLLFFCMQCNSQKPEKNTNPILEEQSSRTADDDYFVGRSMDVFITKLRKYLKEDTSLDIINIHGKGFRLIDNA